MPDAAVARRGLDDDVFRLPDQPRRFEGGRRQRSILLNPSRSHDKVGGHEAVRNQITEDVELMRHTQRRRIKVRFLLGEHLASTRMHATLNQMFHGWGNFFRNQPRSPWRIPLRRWSSFHVRGFSVYPCAGLCVSEPPTAGMIYPARCWRIWVLMKSDFATGLRHERQPQRDAWLFRISGTMMLAIFMVRACGWVTLGSLSGGIRSTGRT